MANLLESAKFIISRDGWLRNLPVDEHFHGLFK
jgi:hypothetical protein